MKTATSNKAFLTNLINGTRFTAIATTYSDGSKQVEFILPAGYSLNNSNSNVIRYKHGYNATVNYTRNGQSIRESIYHTPDRALAYEKQNLVVC